MASPQRELVFRHQLHSGLHRETCSDSISLSLTPHCQQTPLLGSWSVLTHRWVLIQTHFMVHSNNPCTLCGPPPHSNHAGASPSSDWPLVSTGTTQTNVLLQRCSIKALAFLGSQAKTKEYPCGHHQLPSGITELGNLMGTLTWFLCGHSLYVPVQKPYIGICSSWKQDPKSDHYLYTIFESIVSILGAAIFWETEPMTFIRASVCLCTFQIQGPWNSGFPESLTLLKVGSLWLRFKCGGFTGEGTQEQTQGRVGQRKGLHWKAVTREAAGVSGALEPGCSPELPPA